MPEGTWTIDPCARPRLRRARARARRQRADRRACSSAAGYGDPAARARLPRRRAAGARPVPARRHARGVRARSARPSRRGTRICVHGDYDVDGICATALAVLVLRELGADVDWHLPSRFDEGYGVARRDARAARRRGLRARPDRRLRDHGGRGGRARRSAPGLDVVVTDHHRPGDELPDCPVVGPRGRPSTRSPSCAAPASSASSAQALLGADSAALARHLDLVALATIADVVPLLDENRGARRRRPARARAHAEAGPARADARRRASTRPRSTRRRSASGSRRASTPPGASGSPSAALELLLTEDDESRPRARRRSSRS